MMVNRKILSLITIIILILELGQVRVIGQVSATGEDYRVGVGDKLYLSVPQRSDLNRDLFVERNGNINLPLIGEIPVVGLTLQEIEAKVFQSLKDLYPSISSIDISITEAVSQVVYVIGHVGSPGRYTFSSAPNLWEAVREAGGPTAEASLDNVRIIKDQSKGGGSIEVNVQEALEYGTVNELPDLEGGDTVIISQRAQIYTGPLGVNVFGAVMTPGAYKLQGRKDLLNAILLAGGPSDVASLANIKIIRHQSDGSIKTIEVDLRNYLESGDPSSNPPLQAMDTIQVPEKNRFLQSVLSGPFILSVVTAGLSLAALLVAARN